MTADEEERENAMIASWRRSCRDGLCGNCPGCMWGDGKTDEETLEDDQPETEDHNESV
jgi:succinate dehydrogenase/fumarate reductase-like Fe-S protein